MGGGGGGTVYMYICFHILHVVSFGVPSIRQHPFKKEIPKMDHHVGLKP